MKLYWLSIIAFGLFSSRFAYADDTEIYRNTKNRINPNVIFLIDTSGSMAYQSDGKQRIEIVKSAAVAAIDKLETSEPINVAIMRFDDRYGNYEGGYVIHHFTSTDTEQNKQAIKNAINSLGYSNIGGGTPLTESFYEAALYMRGERTYYGTPYFTDYRSVRNGGRGYQWQRNYGSVWASREYRNGQYYYKSPVTATCQKNHIVLFTDGAPSSDNSANGQIQSMLQNSGLSRPSGIFKYCGSQGNNSCAEELAYVLQNKDNFVDSQLNGSIDPNADEIDQKIYVHTVGGFSGIDQYGKDLLNNIAKFGHPINDEHVNEDGTSKHYYLASDEDAIVDALNKLFGGIANSAGNFAAPVVAVNSFNSLEHREELYYSVFQPAELPGWSGNVKRFKMNSDGQILDAKGNPAISLTTGLFRDSATSFWTQGDPDGAQVTEGGLASRLPANRKIYTQLKNSGDIITNQNRVTESNSLITKDMLDDFIPVNDTLTNSERTKALKWARGLDPDTNSPRASMADPLHGNPVMATYRKNSTAVEDVLFIGTNVGYIQAVDPSIPNPTELWAYIPKELLSNLPVYQQGSSRLNKAYGIDGPMTFYHSDLNNDRIIDSNEKAYIVAGMRRGGSHYYLLDISDKSSPSLVSQISSGDRGFEELGQTWSKMIQATVMWKGQPTKVFFFGGGYDVDEDEADVRQNHDKGNAIYMVKAETDSTGDAFDLLWKATGESAGSYGIRFSQMQSSFAGDLTLVDNTGNGIVDLLYAADIGGRIWRMDFNDANTGPGTFATGGIIADFNKDNKAENIRFFTQPDVIYADYGSFESVDPNNSSKTISKKEGRYQITIGSGFRADPLSKTVNDKIFILNDFDIDAAPAKYVKRTTASLADSSRYNNATYAQRRNGSYYELPGNGEKVLSSALTVNNVTYIPTFQPSSNTVNVGCEPDTGRANLIIISPDPGASDTKTKVSSNPLKQGGIVPKPLLTFPPSSPDKPSPPPKITIGTEVFSVSGGFNGFQQTYWRKAK